MLNLHTEFLDRMKGILKDEYPLFLDSLNREQEKAIFVNENKINIDKFKSIIDFPISKIDYEPCGFYVDNEKKGRHPLHHAGAFYLQEPSAMFTVNAYNFNGDEKVLDMCAAPGGKTIQIANRIPNGVLVSNEYVKSRSAVLYSNVERMGIKNVIITNESPENLAKAYANTFDVCVVDAPCSGEGMFRRGEDVVNEWNPNLPKMCAERQIEILKQADIALKQGGVLIYSTCTYSIEENEQVVKSVIHELGYEILNIDANLPRGIDLPDAVRLYPHKVKGEGQFVAVLRKISENEYCPKSSLELKTCKISENFVKNYTNLVKIPQKFGNFTYYIPDNSLIKKDINYVSIGVRLGEVKNDRFEPYHYFYSAFGSDFKLLIDLNLEDQNVYKYLKGEELNIDAFDGYGAVLIEGCAVGGFKLSKGKFKNHYPKGLRNFK